MKKEIVKDDLFLSMKSSSVEKEDLYIADDLLDTVKAHQETCVGMAANMIGYLKRMIVVLDNDQYIIMINPEVLKYSGKTYEANESCLSHDGVKSVKRHECVKVSYCDQDMKKRIKTYKGFTAQIIQHEMDHLEGVLI